VVATILNKKGSSLGVGHFIKQTLKLAAVATILLMRRPFWPENQKKLSELAATLSTY